MMLYSVQRKTSKRRRCSLECHTHYICSCNMPIHAAYTAFINHNNIVGDGWGNVIQKIYRKKAEVVLIFQ